MISRRRLDRVAQALDRLRDELSPERTLDRARAAGVAGAWTWDDARVVFAERAAQTRQYFRESARAWREESNWPNRFRTDDPVEWGALIVTYRLDEDVPSELPAKLLRAAQSPGGWESYGTFNDAADATRVMLALETPDAIHLRRRIWLPHPPRPAPDPESQVDLSSATVAGIHEEQERDAGVAQAPVDR